MRCHIVAALDASEESSGTPGSEPLAARILDALDPAARPEAQGSIKLLHKPDPIIRNWSGTDQDIRTRLVQPWSSLIKIENENIALV